MTVSLPKKKKYEGTCALFYDYEIKDKNGKVRKKQKLTESKSFVKAFLYFLNWQFLAANASASSSLVDTGGTTRTFTTPTSYHYWSAEANNDLRGLIVGTGTNAVTINDTKLQTKINHGTTAGKLQYGASTVASPSFTSTTSYLVFTRVFSNGSTGSITINEIGIYTYHAYGNWYFCVVRDIPTPITLAPGEQLTLNYTLGATI